MISKTWPFQNWKNCTLRIMIYYTYKRFKLIIHWIFSIVIRCYYNIKKSIFCSHIIWRLLNEMRFFNIIFLSLRSNKIITSQKSNTTNHHFFTSLLHSLLRDASSNKKSKEFQWIIHRGPADVQVWSNILYEKLHKNPI